VDRTAQNTGQSSALYKFIVDFR